MEVLQIQCMLFNPFKPIYLDYRKTSDVNGQIHPDT